MSRGARVLNEKQIYHGHWDTGDGTFCLGFVLIVYIYIEVMSWPDKLD